MSESLVVRRLGPGDGAAMRALNRVFARAFEEEALYERAPPRDAYLESRLALPHVIVLTATEGAETLGGLVAYELDKLELERREIYLYDLAVAEPHRRRGLATALINRLREIAHERGAWAVFVQADYADPPAIALYEGLGAREEVLHFDLTPLAPGQPAFAERPAAKLENDP